jgi:hypothetical protein
VLVCNQVLLLLAAGAAGVGVWSICWARLGRQAWCISWGQRLAVLALLGLGGVGLVAAFVRADALAPLGLCAGGLVAGLVWEGPAGRRFGGRSFF